MAVCFGKPMPEGSAVVDACVPRVIILRMDATVCTSDGEAKLCAIKVRVNCTSKLFVGSAAPRGHQNSEHHVSMRQVGDGSFEASVPASAKSRPIRQGCVVVMLCKLSVYQCFESYSMSCGSHVVYTHSEWKVAAMNRNISCFHIDQTCCHLGIVMSRNKDGRPYLPASPPSKVILDECTAHSHDALYYETLIRPSTIHLLGFTGSVALLVALVIGNVYLLLGLGVSRAIVAPGVVVLNVDTI